MTTLCKGCANGFLRILNRKSAAHTCRKRFSGA
ncbi:MAG: hypothetical protein RLZZ502_1061, partial [Pseudomonadota bacterium]